MTGEITAMRERVEATSELPETLAASLAAFGLLLTMLRDREARRDEWFAAFAFASATAAEGRNFIATAPSLPPGPHQLADRVSAKARAVRRRALAELGQVLSERLSQAGACAQDADDQAACRDAGRLAGRIHQLLARVT